MPTWSRFCSDISLLVIVSYCYVVRNHITVVCLLVESLGLGWGEGGDKTDGKKLRTKFICTTQLNISEVVIFCNEIIFIKFVIREVITEQCSNFLNLNFIFVNIIQFSSEYWYVFLLLFLLFTLPYYDCISKSVPLTSSLDRNRLHKIKLQNDLQFVFTLFHNLRAAWLCCSSLFARNLWFCFNETRYTFI